MIKDSAGRYFASFVVQVGTEALPEADTDTGIDLGLSSFAVLRGKVIASPKFFRQAETKIKKASRQVSRKKKGSANRVKARLRLAKVHARVGHRRRDFIEQTTTRIVRENQAAYVEDLNVKGMTGRFGKSMHDQALGVFLRTLEAKCSRYGRGFARVDRWFPSTRMCSQCGGLEGPQGLAGLSVRSWVCPCGVVHDRDANAEINIRNEGRRLLAELAAGQAESLNACGAQVRPGEIPAPRREARTHRSALDNRASARAEDTVGISVL